MSIASEITRLDNTADALETAKTAISAAITAKGGTVGAGDGFADFAAAVAAIPSGGDVPVVTGTYTYTNSAQMYIPHGLGTKKVLVGWRMLPNSVLSASSTNPYVQFAGYYMTSEAIKGYGFTAGGEALNYNNLTDNNRYVYNAFIIQSNTDVIAGNFSYGKISEIETLTDDSVTLALNSRNLPNPNTASHTYRWWAVSLEEPV